MGGHGHEVCTAEPAPGAALAPEAEAAAIGAPATTATTATTANAMTPPVSTGSGENPAIMPATSEGQLTDRKEKQVKQGRTVGNEKLAPRSIKIASVTGMDVSADCAGSKDATNGDELLIEPSSRAQKTTTDGSNNNDNDNNNNNDDDDDDDDNDSIDEEEELLKAIKATPTDTDVFCGRGRGHASKPGNQTFRHIVAKSLCAYEATTSRTLRSDIIKHVVDEARDAGIRFLRFDHQRKWWYDAGWKVAKDKVSHALRDGIVEKKKSALCRRHSIRPPQRKRKGRTSNNKSRARQESRKQGKNHKEDAMVYEETVPPDSIKPAALPDKPSTLKSASLRRPPSPPATALAERKATVDQLQTVATMNSLLREESPSAEPLQRVSDSRHPFAGSGLIPTSAPSGVMSAPMNSAPSACGGGNRMHEVAMASHGSVNMALLANDSHLRANFVPQAVWNPTVASMSQQWASHSTYGMSGFDNPTMWQFQTAIPTPTQYGGGWTNGVGSVVHPPEALVQPNTDAMWLRGPADMWNTSPNTTSPAMASLPLAPPMPLPTVTTRAAAAPPPPPPPPLLTVTVPTTAAAAAASAPSSTSVQSIPTPANATPIRSSTEARGIPTARLTPGNEVRPIPPPSPTQEMEQLEWIEPNTRLEPTSNRTVSLTNAEENDSNCSTEASFDFVGSVFDTDSEKTTHKDTDIDDGSTHGPESVAPEQVNNISNNNEECDGKQMETTELYMENVSGAGLMSGGLSDSSITMQGVIPSLEPNTLPTAKVDMTKKN